MMDIAIYGAGGFAREMFWMLDSFLDSQYRVISFVVDDKYYDSSPKDIYGIPVRREDYLLDYSSHVGIVMAIGSNDARQEIYNKFKDCPYVSFPIVVHPSTIIAPDVEIGEGTIIRGASLLSVNVKVGRGVILNGSTNLGHDVTIGDFCSVMPRSTISGNVTIKDKTAIGAMSFILEKKTIGSNTVVAPGSVVLRSFPDNVIVMGNPAKIYLSKK